MNGTVLALTGPFPPLLPRKLALNTVCRFECINKIQIRTPFRKTGVLLYPDYLGGIIYNRLWMKLR